MINLDDELKDALQNAGNLLIEAHHAVAVTGAGISTPSGIADFRSQDTGLWSKNDPMQVASLSAFRQRPETFYNWLRPIAAQIDGALPNPAHNALAVLEEMGILKAVITQNIDGLHQLAGSKNVIEVHGSMLSLSCPSCKRIYPSGQYRQAFIEQAEMPACPRCGRLLKPDIVLFEEKLPLTAWCEAQQHCERADVVLVAGSSLEVAPANHLPVFALENNARLIINNLTPTYLDPHAELLLPLDVAVALPEIVKLIENKRA